MASCDYPGLWLYGVGDSIGLSGNDLDQGLLAFFGLLGGRSVGGNDGLRGVSQIVLDWITEAA